MTTPHSHHPSRLTRDTDAALPAAAYLRYQSRADGWSAGRRAAFLAHLADNGVVADAARSVGMSLAGGYALRRTARGYAFNLGWEAAVIIARRVIEDQVMTAAIKGEQSRWVREDGVTTYTRQNTKLSLTLLDRVNPALALPEVLAVATRFDLFLQLIDDGVSAQEMWDFMFDDALPRCEGLARARVRAALQLCEELGGFAAGDGDEDNDEDETDDDDDDAPIEYKSMHLCAMDRQRISPCDVAMQQFREHYTKWRLPLAGKARRRKDYTVTFAEISAPFAPLCHAPQRGAPDLTTHRSVTNPPAHIFNRFQQSLFTLLSTIS